MDPSRFVRSGDDEKVHNYLQDTDTLYLLTHSQ